MGVLRCSALAASVLVAACGDDGPSADPDAAGPVIDAGPDAADLETLNVRILGTGFGQLRTNPDGIECPGSCTAEFPRGTEIVVLAPTGQSTFLGWGGACSGPAICEVVLDQPLDVTATFVRGDGTCASPYELMAGDGVYSGVMSGSGQVTGSCGGAGGVERVHLWPAPGNGTVTARVVSETAPLSVYVRPGSCGGTEAGCQTDPTAPGDAMVMFAALAGNSYAIVVDTGTQGPTPLVYELTIDLE